MFPHVTEIDDINSAGYKRLALMTQSADLLKQQLANALRHARHTYDIAEQDERSSPFKRCLKISTQNTDGTTAQAYVLFSAAGDVQVHSNASPNDVLLDPSNTTHFQMNSCSSVADIVAKTLIIIGENDKSQNNILAGAILKTFQHKAYTDRSLRSTFQHPRTRVLRP